MIIIGIDAHKRSHTGAYPATAYREIVDPDRLCQLKCTVGVDGAALASRGYSAARCLATRHLTSGHLLERWATGTGIASTIEAHKGVFDAWLTRACTTSSANRP